MRARTGGYKHVPITGGPDGRIELPLEMLLITDNQ